LVCLRWALTTPARYIGMIGSKRKFIEICKVLEGEGMPLEKLESVHSPVGLDIGALTPEEIAVSIVAEIIAVRRNALPAVPFLAYKPKAQPAT
jgi:xanthine dehydrogenase accessory factor